MLQAYYFPRRSILKVDSFGRPLAAVVPPSVGLAANSLNDAPDAS